MHVMYSMRAFHALGKGEERGNLGRLNSTCRHLIKYASFILSSIQPYLPSTSYRPDSLSTLRERGGESKLALHRDGTPVPLCTERKPGILDGVAVSLRAVRIADQVFFSVSGCLKFFHLKKKKSWVSIAIAVGVCSQHIAT